MLHIHQCRKEYEYRGNNYNFSSCEYSFHVFCIISSLGCHLRKNCIICNYIRRGPRKLAQPKARINESIRSPEVRLIDADGKSVGIVPIKKALERAKQADLDLIEVTAKAKPPVARIADHGKYQYEQNKLKKKWIEQDKEKGKKKQDEVKHTQIKPGTGEDTMQLRAKKIREWLDNGNKVQVDLFLFGRYKSMNGEFLKERLLSFIQTIPGEVYTAESVRKSPKGFSVVLQGKNKK